MLILKENHEHYDGVECMQSASEYVVLLEGKEAEMPDEMLMVLAEHDGDYAELSDAQYELYFGSVERKKGKKGKNTYAKIRVLDI